MRLHELSGSGEDALREEVEERPEYTKQDLIKMIGMMVGFDPSFRKANKILEDNYNFNLLKLIDAMAKNPGKLRQLGSNYSADELISLFEATTLGGPSWSGHHDHGHHQQYGGRQQYGFLSTPSTTTLPDIALTYNMKLHPEYANSPANYLTLKKMINNGFYKLQTDIKEGFGIDVNFFKQIPLPRRGGHGGYGGFGHEHGMSPIAALGDMFTFFQQAIHFGIWAWNVISRIAKGNPMSEIAEYVEQYERSCNDANEPAPTGSPFDHMDPELKKAFFEQSAEVEAALDAGKPVDPNKPLTTATTAPAAPEATPASSLETDFTLEPEEPVEPEQPEPKKPEPKKKVSDEVRLKNEFDTVKNLLTSKKLTKPRFDMFKKQYETFSISFGEIGEIKKFINDIDKKGGAVFA